MNAVFKFLCAHPELVVPAVFGSALALGLLIVVLVVLSNFFGGLTDILVDWLAEEPKP